MIDLVNFQVEVAIVRLTDTVGRILMQQRNTDATKDPNI